MTHESQRSQDEQRGLGVQKAGASPALNPAALPGEAEMLTRQEAPGQEGSQQGLSGDWAGRSSTASSPARPSPSTLGRASFSDMLAREQRRERRYLPWPLPCSYYP